MPAPGQAEKVAMLGVLDWARRGLVVHASRTKRSGDLAAPLAEVDRRYGPKPGRDGTPAVLVLDNGAIRTSRASRAALAERAHWLTVEWLPKHAPELNAIERSWRDLKRHHLAHRTFTGPGNLDAAIHETIGKLNAQRIRHALDTPPKAAWSRANQGTPHFACSPDLNRASSGPIAKRLPS